MCKYTSRVRRGFAFLLDAGLRRKMEELIAEQASHPKRSERFTASERADILGMVDWLEQEAAREDEPTTEAPKVRASLAVANAIPEATS